MRIDKSTTFATITVDGETLDGPWSLTRTVGDLAYAGQLLVCDEESGRCYPFLNVDYLTGPSVSTQD